MNTVVLDRRDKNSAGLPFQLLEQDAPFGQRGLFLGGQLDLGNRVSALLDQVQVHFALALFQLVLGDLLGQLLDLFAGGLLGGGFLGGLFGLALAQALHVGADVPAGGLEFGEIFPLLVFGAVDDGEAGDVGAFSLRGAPDEAGGQLPRALLEFGGFRDGRRHGDGNRRGVDGRGVDEAFAEFEGDGDAVALDLRPFLVVVGGEHGPAAGGGADAHVVVGGGLLGEVGEADGDPAVGGDVDAGHVDLLGELLLVGLDLGVGLGLLGVEGLPAFGGRRAEGHAVEDGLVVAERRGGVGGACGGGRRGARAEREKERGGEE